MTDFEKQQAMGEALKHQRFGRLDNAEDVYRRIISADANQAGILISLAKVLKDTRKPWTAPISPISDRSSHL